MLQAERYPYYSDAIDQSDHEMRKCKFQSENYQPQNIQQHAADTEIARNYLPAERPQDQSCDLEALYPERYAYYGDAKDDSGHCPQQGHYNTAKQQPYNIPYKPHALFPFH